MVVVEFLPKFKKDFSKIRDDLLKIKIKKQIAKIRDNPEIGKPMRNIRKGTKELYIKPFRFSYRYDKTEDKVYILELYHKKFQ